MWTPPILLDAAYGGRSAWLGRSLLALGLIALTAAALSWRNQSAALAEVESALREAQRPQPVVVVKPNPAADARRRWIERELNHPWPRLFDALEAARTPAIRLNAVEAASSNGQVALQGQAIRLADVLDLAERLAEHSLQDVTIRSHQPLADAGDRALAFQLSARWATSRAPDGSQSEGRPR